jgi:hypothetical protein
MITNYSPAQQCTSNPFFGNTLLGAVRSKMETLIKSVATVVKDLVVVPHPTENDCYGISVVFTCQGCKEDYHVDEFDKSKGDAFLHSISIGRPNRNVLCVKCNSHIN